MEIYFYNSLSNKKEKFVSIQKNKVKIYCCGPTVYDYAHIGNFRSFLLSDLLHRLFKTLNYSVELALNITDVDDKIIKKISSTNETLSAYTQKYTDIFFDHLKKLNFLPATFYPKATDHINDMISMIKNLLKKNVAYRSEDGSIYFKINAFKDYGKLSNIQLEHQKVGASNRVDVDEYDKENISDFVLWKSYQEEDGDVFWQDDVLGKGRPGWHIECSAMSKKVLGSHFDIHTGGVDNKFPHHENEIAQSECCNDQEYVNYWLHCSHLMVEDKKMSKSLGNFFTLNDLLQKGCPQKVIRYMLLSTHYRNEYNFKISDIESTDKAIKKVNSLIEILSEKKKSIKNSNEKPIQNFAEEEKQKLISFEKQFLKFLCDDLNTSGALGIVFTAVHFINKHLGNFSLEETKIALNFFKLVDDIFAVFDFEKKKIDVPKELVSLAESRQEFKKQKNYAKADELRNQIISRGYQIIDTKEGFEIKK